MDIEHSLRWHNPGRFNGYVLSQHLAGTPVDVLICETRYGLSRSEPPVQRWEHFSSWPSYSLAVSQNVRPTPKPAVKFS